MANIFKIITFPFRMALKGLKGVGKLLIEGAEEVAGFVADEFPASFVDDLFGLVVILDGETLTNKEKRDEFLDVAKKRAERQGLKWSENVGRALLELLVAKLRKDKREDSN